MDIQATPNKKSTCPLCKTDDEHYRAESDARTLQDAGEVRGDKKRYSHAMKHFEKKHKDTMNAVDMEKKVKAGLQGAFPKDGSEGEY